MLREFVGVGFHSPQGEGVLSWGTAIKKHGEKNGTRKTLSKKLILPGKAL